MKNTLLGRGGGRRASVALVSTLLLVAACYDTTEDSQVDSGEQRPGLGEVDASTTAPSSGRTSAEEVHQNDAAESGAPLDGEIAEAASSCIPHRERVVTVDWQGTAASGADVLTGTRVSWLLSNRSDEDVVVDLTLTLDTGGLTTKGHAIGRIAIPAGHEVVQETDLAEFVPSLAELRFSGMAMLTARDVRHHWTTVGQPRFFHPEGGSLHLYDEQILNERYHHGDFRFQVEEEMEQGVVTTRIVSAKDVIVSNDDGLEQEVIEGKDEVSP